MKKVEQNSVRVALGKLDTLLTESGELSVTHLRVAQRLRELEGLALRSGQSQLFIETPYRNLALWQALLESLQPGTRLAVASGLSLPQARIGSRTVAQWKKAEAPVSAAVPAVFLLGR